MTVAAAGRFAVFAAIFLSGLAPAWATTVYVTSVGYGDVQLVINGQLVRSLRIGETSPEGVRLEDVQAGVATLIVDGRTMQMRIGQSTVTQVVLNGDARGQFVTTAQINGVPVRAMIDTGATYVSLGAADAQRMGIDYLQGRQSVNQTANGPVNVYVVNLPHVQIGELAFTNVTGAVTADARVQMPHVLIGMSFLRLVDMRRSGNTLTLSRADR